jgi:uncharacterized protein YegL
MEQQPYTETGNEFGPAEKELALLHNPEPRCPCILILDVSSSMAGEPIRQLNDGLISFKDELAADSLASKRVEVAVITFGSEAKLVCDFATQDAFYPPSLQANGLTYMGAAVNMAIDAVAVRKCEYKAHGISYYRPWLFLISDGAPNDPNWESAAARAISEESAKSFKMFCVGVKGADMQTLQKFCQGTPVVLDGLRFRDMFTWLSSSLRSVSRSTPGDTVPIEDPTKKTDGWATGWDSV